jgi:hypothetical protein
MGATASNAKALQPTAGQASRPTYGPSAPNNSLQKLSWVLVSDGLLADAIGWVCSAGDAISFSAGAQGRWLGVTLLCSEGVVKRRFDSIEEAQAGLMEICDTARARAK